MSCLSLFKFRQSQTKINSVVKEEKKDCVPDGNDGRTDLTTYWEFLTAGTKVNIVQGSLKT